jgi:hypothetical protein
MFGLLRALAVHNGGSVSRLDLLLATDHFSIAARFQPLV